MTPYSIIESYHELIEVQLRILHINHKIIKVILSELPDKDYEKKTRLVLVDTYIPYIRD